MRWNQTVADNVEIEEPEENQDEKGPALGYNPYDGSAIGAGSGEPPDPNRWIEVRPFLSKN